MGPKTQKPEEDISVYVPGEQLSLNAWGAILEHSIQLSLHIHSLFGVRILMILKETQKGNIEKAN